MRAIAALQLFLLNLLHVQSFWRQFDPPKQEGEVCGRLRGEQWTCQLESQCKLLPSILKEDRKITCSTLGDEHLICCPRPRAQTAQTAVAISETKCQEYHQEVCNNIGSFYIDIRFGQVVSPSDRKDEVQNSSGFRDERQIDDGMFDERGTVVTDGPAFARGGEQALAREFPYAAMIGYGSEGRIQWSCGGSLISEQFVLSAAHCSETERSGPATWVRLGDLDYSSDTDDAQPQQFNIVERIVHSEYRKPAFYNDIALFRLDRPAVFDEYVAPACLHFAKAEDAGLVTAAGWGKTERHSGRSSQLIKIDTNLISTPECKSKLDGEIGEQYLRSGVDGRTMICAYNLQKDTCDGDSGGPMVINDRGDSCLSRLVGVTSFGPAHCQETEFPSVYVRVSAFIPWIESIVWPESSNITGSSLPL